MGLCCSRSRSQGAFAEIEMDELEIDELEIQGPLQLVPNPSQRMVWDSDGPISPGGHRIRRTFVSGDDYWQHISRFLYFVRDDFSGTLVIAKQIYLVRTLSCKDWAGSERVPE